jgi:endonuclease/exonuclease/phosphatase family metal-dependent hydrolase
MSLTVVSWNIWFDEHRRDERTTMLCEVLHRANGDVVCLQEVTEAVMPALRSCDALRGFYLSEPDLATREGYGTLIASRIAPNEVLRTELPSSMRRDLHAVVLAWGGERLAVGTVHLESRRWNGDVRSEQLDVALAQLRALAPATLLCGDFNFDDGWDEDTRLRAMADIRDVWTLRRGLAPGYTVDTRRNAMAAAHASSEKERRYDRMLLCSPPGRWRVNEVALLGEDAHPHDACLYASDHFGLRAVLQSQSER